MLHELVVRNLGVIEHAQIVLRDGVTGLTGETGAGKTLVTEAINLLTGGRADAVLVRPGAHEASVEGRFVTPDDAEVVVRRVVPADGRSRSYLDGNFATIAELSETIGPLVEVHGQHGHQAMLRSAARRSALDRFGGHDLVPLTEARRSLREARAQLEELGGDEIARTREIELLRYQVDEIEQAAIVDAGEDERLAERELVLGDAAAHGEAAESSVELLSADGAIGSALAEIIAKLDGRSPFTAITERVYAVQAEIADLAEELRDLAAGIDDDPESLVTVQSRRETLTALRRKYGADLHAVLNFAEEATKRLDELEHHGERAAILDARILELEAAEAREASVLLEARCATAPRLAKAVQAELRKLALPKAEFEIVIDGSEGNDVDFAVSMNPGSPVLPIAKVASGGELSRVMLALQLVLGGGAGTVIYDEIDAGVGGEAATAIGQALAGVGRTNQVFVVTHLPQVAACADHQINIVKSASGGVTATELHELDREGRVVELARMLSGSPDSESARTHAAELLDAR
ncbi:MAG: DNA repair protein RecN [Actinomycetota bacterium]